LVISFPSHVAPPPSPLSVVPSRPRVFFAVLHPAFTVWLPFVFFPFALLPFPPKCWGFLVLFLVEKAFFFSLGRAARAPFFSPPALFPPLMLSLFSLPLAEVVWTGGSPSSSFFDQAFKVPFSPGNSRPRFFFPLFFSCIDRGL